MDFSVLFQEMFDELPNYRIVCAKLNCIFEDCTVYKISVHWFYYAYL